LSVRESLRNSGVRLTWARVFQPYGPGQDKKRLVPYLFHSIRQGRDVQISDTSSILDWITTRDIASAISFIVQKSTEVEVDIGTSIGYTNIELLRHIEEILGKTKQWEKLVEQTVGQVSVSLVGKRSPLFVAGWRPNDGLEAGLKWIDTG